MTTTKRNLFFDGTPFAPPRAEGEEPLGPWQAGFEAWTPMSGLVLTLPPDHFQTTLLTQIIEVREALAKGDTIHALKEMNDIISVTLNWMRAQGATEDDIAHVARMRAANRYEGQTQAIMDKYRAKYGI